MNGATARSVTSSGHKTARDETARDETEFRNVMSLFPCSVVAITGCRDGVASGLTVGSFFSASLQPRLVGFCIARHSTTWAFLRPTGRFCVNLLAAGQRAVSESLSRSGTADKLSAVAWERSPDGLPLITAAIAWMTCDIAREYDAGDHLVVIARVRDMAVSNQDEPNPLIFFQRGYHATVAVGE